MMLISNGVGTYNIYWYSTIFNILVPENGYSMTLFENQFSHYAINGHYSPNFNDIN